VWRKGGEFSDNLPSKMIGKPPSFFGVDLEVVSISRSRFSGLVVCDDTFKIVAACLRLRLDDDTSRATPIGIDLIGKVNLFPLWKAAANCHVGQRFASSRSIGLRNLMWFVVEGLRLSRSQMMIKNRLSDI